MRFCRLAAWHTRPSRLGFRFNSRRASRSVVRQQHRITRPRPMTRRRSPLGGKLAAVAIALALVGSLGCRSATNNRNWAPNQAVLPTADFNGNLVTVHNVRNTTYRTAEDYTVRHYDKTYDLNRLDTVDFVMVPLPEV